MEKRSGEKGAALAKPTKKARTATPPRNKAAAVAVPKKEKDPETAQREAEEEPNTIDVTLPADALECPLCFAPFEAAVFQCKNGHAACRACCDRVQGTCPSCREPIGVIRCRPLEAAIAGMLVPCGFSKAGCRETRLPFAAKRAHEALYCHHAPCACPVPGCAYSGLLLHDHLRDDDDAHHHRDECVGFVREVTVTLHRSMPFRVLLHAPDARVFLLLNGGGVPSAGRSLALVSVGPRPAPDRALEYTMLVRGGGAGEQRGPGGALSLSASGPVACTRRWAAGDDDCLPPEGFLFVPDAYWSSSGSVSVTVHVKKLVVALPPPAAIDRA